MRLKKQGKAYIQRKRSTKAKKGRKVKHGIVRRIRIHSVY